VAGDPRKRQKKQERRAAKRKTKHHDLARTKSAGLPERMAAATRFPVLFSWASDGLWTEGMGSVGLSRKLPSGLVAVGTFLVDRYCLGVKDAMAAVLPAPIYESKVIRGLPGGAKPMAPATVRRLVEQAVAYAASLGFHPHPDFHKARIIFGDIDPAQAEEEFAFGKDGKPLFIAGPYDTPERCRQVMRTLERAVGPDGYHFTIPFGASSEGLLEESIEGESIEGKVIRVIPPDEEETPTNLSEIGVGEEEYS